MTRAVKQKRKGSYEILLKHIVESYYKTESESLENILNFIPVDLTVFETVQLYAEVREMISKEHVVRVVDLDMNNRNRILTGHVVNLVS